MTEEIEQRTEQVLLPVAKIEDLVKSMKLFEKVKSELLSQSDTYQIAGDAPRIRASGWRKLALAFGVSDEIMHEERVLDPGDPTHIIVRFEVRVFTHGGRMATGVGSASTKERKFQHQEHDLRALAHTRAKSRAIRDILGGSDQIAEEEPEDPGQPEPISLNHQQKPVPSTSSKVMPLQDPKLTEKVRGFWGDSLGEEIAGKLLITMTDDGPKVFLPAPYSEYESKRFMALAWECSYATTESAAGITAMRKAK